jgi:dinuclear metal center YbgI/SA1388 family protein
MKLSVLISAIEAIAPPFLQEDYDNSGLIVGAPEQEVNRALLTLDCTEAVVDEAIELGCELIVAHHPIVFRGLKRFNESNYVEKTVMKAIRNNICIYACHTNLDNVLNRGVNAKIAEKLGLKNTRILAPVKNRLSKLCVFVPSGYADAVRDAMFEAGAGQIGKYAECSFNTEGTGTYTPGADSRPFLGEKGKRQMESELRIEAIVPSHLASRVISAVKKVHPYEEVAWDLFSLENAWQDAGSGLIGELEEEVDGIAFTERVKQMLNAKVVRHTGAVARVKTVAVCGGAGSFLIKTALNMGADAFVTADVKYHEFFDAEGRMMICDPGHYESEQFTTEIFHEILSEKFPNFATIFSRTQTNPVLYQY